jgi:predicted nucleic acid-binding protein
VTVVLDSSAVVALLVESGGIGRWVDEQVTGHPLVAPHVMPAEVGNVLRRRLAAGVIDEHLATAAHRNLGRVPLDLFAYTAFADRVWTLRDNVTAYDAWYVALAESLDAPLVTLDLRLARASGPRCEFLTPDSP